MTGILSQPMYSELTRSLGEPPPPFLGRPETWHWIDHTFPLSNKIAQLLRCLCACTWHRPILSLLLIFPLLAIRFPSLLVIMCSNSMICPIIVDFIPSGCPYPYPLSFDLSLWWLAWIRRIMIVSHHTKSCRCQVIPVVLKLLGYNGSPQILFFGC